MHLFRETTSALVLFFSFTWAHAADIATSTAGEAFYIEPMELRLALKGDGKSSQIKIVNKEDHESRIRVDVFERTDSIDGAEQRVLTKDIRIEEPEFLLPAGRSKSIQISYHGPKKVSREHAYRVVVKQVDSAPGQNAMRSLDMRFVYVASVYVTPAHAEPKLIVKEVRQTSARDLEVDFHNSGTAHQKMSDLKTMIERSDSHGTHEIALSDESRQLLSRQNFLSGSRRKLLLQVAANETLTSGTVLNVKLTKSRTNTTNGAR